MTSDTAFDWGDHTVAENIEHALRLGPLHLRFLQRSGEIHLAWDRSDDDEEPSWSRWAPAQWSGDLRLTPVQPDRLVVVKPESEFWLLRGSRARIYVRVPLHVRVEALGPSPRTLLRLPTAILSDTWWGTREEGELGYWLDTRARRAIGEGDFEEHLCVCPLQLENTSRDDLLVDRIALRVAHLSVFRDREHLWADETRVRYLGVDAGSHLDTSGRPPEEAPDAELVTPPAEARARGLTAWTFARIRSSLEGWL